MLPPNVASLHIPRVGFEDPFQNSGYYFTGQLGLRRELQKKIVYLLLFTCLSVRAFHMAVLTDMSDVLVISSSSALYGDNAKIFWGSARLFSRHYLYHEYQEILGTCNIKLNIILLISP